MSEAVQPAIPEGWHARLSRESLAQRLKDFADENLIAVMAFADHCVYQRTKCNKAI